MSSDFDVVIVGGGAAGIGAARRLAASGLKAVLLEASSRLGGRARTLDVAGLHLDLGCGWLHSADRNAWTELARAAHVALVTSTPAWGIQYRDLGFSATEQRSARKALADWSQRLATAPPASDRAADALDAQGDWNDYVRIIAGFISGGRVENLSAADYVAYDQASTELNWRVPTGYGALVVASFPRAVSLRLDTPVESIGLDTQGVTIVTPAGGLRARALIITASTHVLAGDAIKLPAALRPWREAAADLPLGHVEKVFLAIDGDAPFENETQVLANPRDPRTGSYYLRPMGMPVIEGFFGNEGARHIEQLGPAGAFDFACEQIIALFGADVRHALRPLVVSDWSRTDRVGGAYSYALPGRAPARQALAQPFDQRIFFAGEATSRGDFSTAHGAHDSGVRAAGEVIAALGDAAR